MEYIKCEKCQIVYLGEGGHKCSQLGNYNEEDEFMSSYIAPIAASLVLDNPVADSNADCFQNSDFCIW